MHDGDGEKCGDGGRPTGPSAAAAALRNHHCGIARSFRFHRPRGAFCHAGWCQQCRVATPDGPRLACQRDAREPAQLRCADTLRPIGRYAEQLPPWFHERVIQPEALRQPFLDWLRSLSAAPRASPCVMRGRGKRRDLTCWTLVAGGGLSGLRAAKAIAETGRDVLLIEAERLGGRAAFDPHRRHEIEPAIVAARTAGVRMREDALVAGLYEEPRRALVTTAAGPIIIGFEDLVVATGSYDRLPAFPGNDLPGIIGAGAFARLLAVDALPPGATIVLAGSAEGVAVVQSTARAHGVVIAHHHVGVPIAVDGRRWLTRVRFTGNEAVPADLLVLALRQPSYELILQAGCTATVAGDPVTVMPVGLPVMPLLTVGSAAVGDLGSTGPEALAAFLSGSVTAYTARPAPLAAPPAPQSFACLCEDVRIGDLDAAIRDGFDDMELLKRRTGACTGPCQGKLCHGEVAACLARHGKRVALPTQRPFSRPVLLAEMAEPAP